MAKTKAEKEHGAGKHSPKKEKPIDKFILDKVEEVGREIDRRVTRKKRHMQEWARSSKKELDLKGLLKAINKNKGGTVKNYAKGGGVRKAKFIDS